MAKTLRNAYGRFIPNGVPKQHKGYLVEYAPAHPHARQNGYVYTHVLVVEEQLGRCLAPGEVVHHVNGDKTDNRPENLQVLPSSHEHARLHWSQRATKYTIDGNEYTLQELADKYDIPYSCLYQRVRRLHWPITRAVIQKVR